MTFLNGKAIEGGTPLTDEEIERLAHDQIDALQKSFAKRPATEKSTDVLSLRLAEELRLVQRMIDLVETKLSGSEARQLQESEDALGDIADVVEAADRCDAIDMVDPDLGRRLTRRSLGGEAAPCDNRRPSILRKQDSSVQ